MVFGHHLTDVACGRRHKDEFRGLALTYSRRQAQGSAKPETPLCVPFRTRTPSSGDRRGDPPPSTYIHMSTQSVRLSPYQIINSCMYSL